MKTTLLSTLGVLLLMGGGLAAQIDREPSMSLVRVSGWIVDAKKGAEHANADSKQAVLDNHDKGSPLIFVTDSGKVYALSDEDQAKAVEKVGAETVILGSKDGEGNLKIGSFLRPKNKKPAEPDEPEPAVESGP